MKILIVAPSIEPDRNVGAVRMSSLSRYLVCNNHQIYILTNAKKEKVSIPGLAGVEYVEIVDSQLAGSKRMKAFKLNAGLYLKAFEKTVSKESIDLVIVSGGPFYTFCISKASGKKKIPCILDFRDPWFLDVRANSNRRSIKYLARKSFQYFKEYNSIKNASAVITVTESWQEQFRKKYPFKSEKIFLIENGFDDALLNNVDFPPVSRHGFTIGVFGKLFYYTKTYSDVFLSAMEKISDVQITQVGTKEKELEPYFERHGISRDLVHCTGFMDYVTGIKTLSNADVFLIIDERKGALGTKVYDYIYLNKPIIYVGPKETALSNLVMKFENGFVCSTKEEVIQSIERIRTEGIKKLTDGTVDIYARSYQNQKWLKLIHKIAEGYKS